MFSYIVRNEGTHIIIGKAASAHHAWVVGALESAVRSVYQFLYKHSAKCNHVLQEYNQDKVAKPTGPIPKEFDRTKDVKPLNAKTGKVVTGCDRGRRRSGGAGEREWGVVEAGSPG